MSTRNKTSERKKYLFFVIVILFLINSLKLLSQVKLQFFYVTD